MLRGITTAKRIGLLSLLLACVFALQSVYAQSPAPAPAAYSRGNAEQDLALGNQVSEALPWAELLGPLAPVALSPFFGITCLSGCAMLVERGVLPENRLLRQSEVLQHPSVFLAFLVLTVLTSLPRFSKVSKPLAQAIDYLETYAGLVTIIVIHYLARHGGPDGLPDGTMLAAGFAGTAGDGLLIVLCAVNILVIQTVRSFFELLVLLSPLPLVDAAFEVANKAVCAGLLLIYALHPAAALGINLLLFLICLCIVRWAHRKTVYYRHLYLAPMLHRLRRLLGWRTEPSWPTKLPSHLLRHVGSEPEFVLPVFPAESMGRIPRQARCFLVRSGSTWHLVRPRALRAPTRELLAWRPTPRIRDTWMANVIDWEQDGLQLLFSNELNAHLGAIAGAAGFVLETADPVRDTATASPAPAG